MVVSSKLSKPRDMLAPRAAMAEELRRKCGRASAARQTVTLAGSTRDDRFVAGGVWREGSRDRGVKLSRAGAKSIRELITLGVSAPEIAEQFGVSRSTVFNIASCRSYPELGPPLTVDSGCRRGRYSKHK